VFLITYNDWRIWGCFLDIKQKVTLLLESLKIFAAAGFDIRDFFVFSGLFILSYGLYLYAPWLGYFIGGLLLMIIGYLMKDSK